MLVNPPAKSLEFYSLVKMKLVFLQMVETEAGQSNEDPSSLRFSPTYILPGSVTITLTYLLKTSYTFGSPPWILDRMIGLVIVIRLALLKQEFTIFAIDFSAKKGNATKFVLCNSFAGYMDPYKQEIMECGKRRRGVVGHKVTNLLHILTYQQ